MTARSTIAPPRVFISTSVGSPFAVGTTGELTRGDDTNADEVLTELLTSAGAESASTTTPCDGALVEDEEAALSVVPTPGTCVTMLYE